MNRGIYDEEHVAFRESVRAFLDRLVWPRVEEFIELKTLPRDLWLAAGEHELLGLEVPEEFGGVAAQDFRFNAVLTEELSGVNVALASAFGIHSDIVAPYLTELTTPEQQERWLPGFASGRLVGAIGMTEPSGGSDLAALTTTATRDGDAWILNGAKTFITNGAYADLVVVAARTTPGSRSKGISLFVVEAGMAGFERGKTLDKVGQPEAATAELYFDNVRVPHENLLGELDHGFQHMMDRLPQERLNAAVSNLAHARRIFQETVAYAGERRAFGQAIGSHQHNKFMLAEMVTRLDVSQSFLDACVLAHTRDELTAVDAAKAKWWSAQVQSEVLDRCLQLFGGYGYMNEYRVARAWKDARVTRIWAGSDEIMKEIIGRDLGF
ncbi:acyl-CoA dehydrogenase family protein [Pseudarthrobacter sulfonivorans]|uniref:acyl-CoA dehydrogenase family protein n=1 Tax=Pseudarthrobacter sulfonivorans TaxID=121292 RepID=UPI002106B9E9|nr:acyl-CoA dehydrogenase family protein [Pseudarthrobacter sulfonivorans]